MDNNLLSQVIAYSVPALVMGLVAYAVLHKYLNYILELKRIQLHQDHEKHGLELRLQAYERMTLYLERINPNKLLVRVPAVSDDKMTYFKTLLNIIESEYEHNLTQQIYMSSETWNLINSAKNSIIQILKNEAVSEYNISTSDFRESVLKTGLSEQLPTNHALSILKQEVSELF